MAVWYGAELPQLQLPLYRGLPPKLNQHIIRKADYARNYGIWSSQLYRCKDVNCPYDEAPKHGSVSWRYDGTHWFELRFWHKPPNQTGWMSADEFSRLKEQVRQDNIEFYRSHPNDLRRKIDLKRKGARLLRSSGLLRPYEWA